MITAETLQRLTQFSKRDLVKILSTSGYTGVSFESAEFLGMTNGGQFCYKVTFFDDAGTGEHEVGKVFVSLDQATGVLTADY